MSLEDLGSVNGTRIKDQPVPRGERVSIRIGDTIQIGSSVLIVQRRTAPVGAAARDVARHRPGRRPSAALPPRGEAMQRVHALAERAAAGTINVLITGETGVGKELLAETVHRASPRRDGPFVCLNCAALSETLLESELFGHERGAFTGAVEAKPGLLETADGGTLFLDEVGELPLATQAKLLRVIETREVTRLGSVRPRRIDVRFIAATNRDLEAEVGRGAFRQDLYFRLAGITLTIPPLRERVDEIRQLAELFARQICRELGARRRCCRRRSSSCSSRTPGPATSASSRTSWSARCCCARARSSGREHLPLEKLSPGPRAREHPLAARRHAEDVGTDGARQDHRRAERLRRQPEPRRQDARDAAPHVRQQARPLQDPAPQKEERRRYRELDRLRALGRVRPSQGPALARVKS